MLKLSLSDYSDAYILVKDTITITGRPTDTTKANKGAGERNKEVIFSNCTPVIECSSKINNTQIDHAKHLNIVTQCIS